MDDLQFKVTVNEGKIIFMALTDLPFKLVFELIGKLNKQSNSQVPKDGEIILLLSRTDIELIFEALSKQPYSQVYRLMDKITTRKAF
jgi:hypothetical protein